LPAQYENRKEKARRKKRRIVHSAISPMGLGAKPPVDIKMQLI